MNQRGWSDDNGFWRIMSNLPRYVDAGALRTTRNIAAVFLRIRRMTLPGLVLVAYLAAAGAFVFIAFLLAMEDEWLKAGSLAMIIVFVAAMTAEVATNSWQLHCAVRQRGGVAIDAPPWYGRFGHGFRLAFGLSILLFCMMLVKGTPWSLGHTMVATIAAAQIIGGLAALATVYLHALVGAEDDTSTI